MERALPIDPEAPATIVLAPETWVKGPPLRPHAQPPSLPTNTIARPVAHQEPMDFIYIAGEEYKSGEILDMERKILMTIDFDVSQCTSFRFLERFSKLAKIDNVTFFLSQFMLELGLLDSKMSQFPQSLQAIAAIYTAKKYMQFSEKTSESAGSTSKGAPSQQSLSTLILSDLNCP